MPKSHIRCRLRISLVGSDPEIWRTLDVDGALHLGELHDVIQIAMGWRDAHLHEFAEEPMGGPRHPLPRIGRDPLRWSAPHPDDDDPGLAESEWTVARVFAELHGPLFYEYDFGDGWTHSIELIELEDDAVDEPRAVLVRGERRGPLEDCGGVHGYQSLLATLANPADANPADPARAELVAWIEHTLGPWVTFDPEALDVASVNRELALRFDTARVPDTAVADAAAPPRSPVHAAAHAAAHAALDDLLDRMPAAYSRDLRAYLAETEALSTPAIDEPTAAEMTRPLAWLIDRVGAEGLTLTQAGWLPPVVVNDAMRELGWADLWQGKQNREDMTFPIMHLRATAQRLGLVRKLKGKLVLGSPAKRSLGDPVALWWFVASHLALHHRSQPVADATMLLAVEVASARHSSENQYWGPIAFCLDALAWGRRDGMPLSAGDVREAIRDSWDVLELLGVFELTRRTPGRVTAGGREFARAMLRA